MVSVGFLSAFEQNGAPSVRNTFFASHVWPHLFVTDFAGSVYSADLDGKNERNFLYAQGNLTGIAYAEV